jgi:hypothetical protein
MKITEDSDGGEEIHHDDHDEEDEHGEHDVVEGKALVERVVAVLQLANEHGQDLGEGRELLN